MPEFSEEDAVRFAKFVGLATPSGCLEWQGCYGGRLELVCRYGQFSARGLSGRQEAFKAHRVAWKLRYKKDPTDRILHTCDNPKCVNSEHLFEGSPLDNSRDAATKGRSAFGDRNGSRLYPERLVRGEDHWCRKSPERLQGVSNPAAKLDENAVLEIRVLRSYGANQYHIAEAYGITQGLVSQIQRRAVWSHLP